jgi:lantibiotic transport system permease protein
MIAAFINSYQSEWLKRKRSAASWLTLLGAMFIPLIEVIGRMINFDSLYKVNTSDEVWISMERWAWQPMAAFLLPLGIILATSLVTQLEFKNNGWKQLHATPQSFPVIYLSKLSVIVTMMFQFFIIFNIGVYLMAALPSLIFRGIPYPTAPIPFWMIFKLSLKFFICSLPIISLQYLVSLQFRNFLIPVGIGFGVYVASMMAMSWKYYYVMPYLYLMKNFGRQFGGSEPEYNIYLLSLLYCFIFLTTGFVLYTMKKDKS